MRLDHSETIQNFSERKKDHIRLSLEERNQSYDTELSKIQLIHEALPNLDFEEVTLETEAFSFSKKPINISAPLLISSMTAGHVDSMNLNLRLAQAADRRGWLMGVGSQRRELGDPEAAQEWRDIRKLTPNAKMMGNLGLSQLIHTELDDVKRLIDALEPVGLFIHTNPLQEALQQEGTPHFKGGVEAIKKLCRDIDIPVVLKECGCGVSKKTLNQLRKSGLAAVDVSGRGGTHWGRIEGRRSDPGSSQQIAADTFADWGISTVNCLIKGGELNEHSPLDFELWGSGGVRNGLDAAKMLAIGASIVGLAKPVLEAALESEEALEKFMQTLEYELKVALFCSGFSSPDEFRAKGLWQWKA